jgi:hypothetical protein
VFPIHVGWSIVSCHDFASPIKIPDFTQKLPLGEEWYPPLTSFMFLSSFNLWFTIDSLLLFYCLDINVVETKANANRILGPISAREDGSTIARVRTRDQ